MHSSIALSVGVGFLSSHVGSVASTPMSSLPLPPAAPVLPLLLPAVLPATALPMPPEDPALLALPLTSTGTCGAATSLSAPLLLLLLLPLGPVAAGGLSPLLPLLPSAPVLLLTGPSAVSGTVCGSPVPAGSPVSPAPAAGVSALGLPPGGGGPVGLSSLSSVPCPMPLLLTSKLPSVDAAVMGISSAGSVREPLLQSTSAGLMHSTSPMDGLARVLQYMLLTTSPELMLTQSKLRRCTYCGSTDSQGGSSNRGDCTLELAAGTGDRDVTPTLHAVSKVVCRGHTSTADTAAATGSATAITTTNWLAEWGPTHPPAGL